MERVSSFQYGNVLVIRISPPSSKDQHRPEQLREELVQLVDSGANVVLDLAEQRSVNSNFLSAMLALDRRCRDNGATLKLCDVSPELRDILSVMHLDKLFQIYPSQDDAIASFAAVSH